MEVREYRKSDGSVVPIYRVAARKVLSEEQILTAIDPASLVRSALNSIEANIRLYALKRGMRALSDSVITRVSAQDDAVVFERSVLVEQV